MVLDGNQYRVIVESAPNLVWRAGKDAMCDYFNATWLNYTGRTMEEELGNGWSEGVHPDDYDRCVQGYMQAFNNREVFELVYRIRRNDGQWRWLHDRGAPFYDDNNEFAGYIGSCIDVNEQITGETWKTMAQKDGLTGLFNRFHFELEARQLYQISWVTKRRLCAVMIDIDNFKYFNDHYGHSYGDKVLVSFAAALKETIRDTDLLSRYGGDEFILLLPETSRNRAEQLINRIKNKLENPDVNFEGEKTRLSFSYGIAEMQDSDSYEAFIEKADRLMYTEKNKKR